MLLGVSRSPNAGGVAGTNGGSFSSGPVHAVDLPQRRQVEQSRHLDDVAGMDVELAQAAARACSRSCRRRPRGEPVSRSGDARAPVPAPGADPRREAPDPALGHATVAADVRAQAAAGGAEGLGPSCAMQQRVACKLQWPRLQVSFLPAAHQPATRRLQMQLTARRCRQLQRRWLPLLPKAAPLFCRPHRPRPTSRGPAHVAAAPLLAASSGPDATVHTATEQAAAFLALPTAERLELAPLAEPTVAADTRHQQQQCRSHSQPQQWCRQPCQVPISPLLLFSADRDEGRTSNRAHFPDVHLCTIAHTAVERLLPMRVPSSSCCSDGTGQQTIWGLELGNLAPTLPAASNTARRLGSRLPPPPTRLPRPCASATAAPPPLPARQAGAAPQAASPQLPPPPPATPQPGQAAQCGLPPIPPQQAPAPHSTAGLLQLLLRDPPPAGQQQPRALRLGVRLLLASAAAGHRLLRQPAVQGVLRRELRRRRRERPCRGALLQQLLGSRQLPQAEHPVCRPGAHPRPQSQPPRRRQRLQCRQKQLLRGSPPQRPRFPAALAAAGQPGHGRRRFWNASAGCAGRAAAATGAAASRLARSRFLARHGVIAAGECSQVQVASQEGGSHGCSAIACS